MRTVRKSTDWPQGDTRPPEIRAKDARRAMATIDVPLAFGGAKASIVYATSITDFAKEHGIPAAIRELEKQGRDDRTIAKYIRAVKLRLEDEKLTNNGESQE